MMGSTDGSKRIVNQVLRKGTSKKMKRKIPKELLSIPDCKFLLAEIYQFLLLQFTIGNCPELQQAVIARSQYIKVAMWQLVEVTVLFSSFRLHLRRMDPSRGNSMLIGGGIPGCWKKGFPSVSSSSILPVCLHTATRDLKTFGD